MVKIESMTPGCVAKFKSSGKSLFAGQLIELIQVADIEVSVGELVYSVDETVVKSIKAPAPVAKPAPAPAPVAKPAPAPAPKPAPAKATK